MFKQYLDQHKIWKYCLYEKSTFALRFLWSLLQRGHNHSIFVFSFSEKSAPPGGAAVGDSLSRFIQNHPGIRSDRTLPFPWHLPRLDIVHDFLLTMTGTLHREGRDGVIRGPTGISHNYLHVLFILPLSVGTVGFEACNKCLWSGCLLFWFVFAGSIQRNLVTFVGQLKCGRLLLCNQTGILYRLFFIRVIIKIPFGKQ